jgi:hypothetical protein
MASNWSALSDGHHAVLPLHEQHRLRACAAAAYEAEEFAIVERGNGHVDACAARYGSTARS